MNSNQLELIGVVQEIAVLRYTPARIPLLSLVLQHVSEQIEAGMQRRVECEVSAMILGELAITAQHLTVGASIKVTGFIAKRSLKSTQLVLHIQTLTLV